MLILREYKAAVGDQRNLVIENTELGVDKVYDFDEILEEVSDISSIKGFTKVIGLGPSVIRMDMFPYQEPETCSRLQTKLKTLVHLNTSVRNGKLVAIRALPGYGGNYALRLSDICTSCGDCLFSDPTFIDDFDNRLVVILDDKVDFTVETFCCFGFWGDGDNNGVILDMRGLSDEKALIAYDGIYDRFFDGYEGAELSGIFSTVVDDETRGLRLLRKLAKRRGSSALY